ncbi:MAG: hypothetical protein U0359_23540 [Byssovorax sp.]
MVIGEDEARAIAQAYVEQGSAGFTFRFVATPQRRSDDWSMVFDCITPAGNILDGPIVGFVDKQTGRARTLWEDAEKKRLRK